MAREIELQLNRLEAELRRLEAEYKSYFAGRLPRPPWETRTTVGALVKQIDRSPVINTAERFRFSTLQARYASFIDLWDRALRAREEGRGGPLATPKDRVVGRGDRVVHVSSFRDPTSETDKLKELYESMSEARREVGADKVPFNKFAELVKQQVSKLNAGGASEVAFRVTVKDGKVNFTARPMKPGDNK